MKKEAEKNIDYEYYENGKIERTIERLEDGGIITNSYSGLGKLISTREEKENSIINKEYYRSGVLKSEESYSRVEENGEYHVYGNIKDYYSNGNLESEVTTVDSLYHGEYKKYHSNGVLEHERTYENGKGLNNFKFYKENGKLEYDHEKSENSLINKLHSFIFKRNKEKENLEEKETYIWRSYTDGASPQDLVYKEIEDRKNEIIYKGLEKEEAELENDKVISHEKNKENKELDNIYKEYYDNGSLKLEYENRISKEYYQDGKLKSSKEYDENLEADGTWKFYDEDGTLYRIEAYSGGELLEVSEKDGTTVGFVHYVYNGYNEVQRKEYAPNEDEYIKVYYEDGGAKDIYHERDGMTFYTRRNENDEIVAKGTFDEEMKKVGDWVTLDKTNTPTNIKTYDEDILIKEVNYKNGILNGPMREYDKGTGELISEKIFKGGAEEKLMETLRAAQPTQEKSQGIER
ncbi:hypothetical protein [Fusobacterium ulcerans]|uniref:toxin-antitoxin system YwqK family antitoxin n=1 Tax=Fusobacterium ulcerans TaxID=861 RepID=UPI002E780C82|nr:hypothetical protein [Fusobacterium ulcerans]MEE0137702.1 hypothetical protein [Fusobacterium ulcerans]